MAAEERGRQRKRREERRQRARDRRSQEGRGRRSHRPHDARGAPRRRQEPRRAARARLARRLRSDGARLALARARRAGRSAPRPGAARNLHAGAPGAERGPFAGARAARPGRTVARRRRGLGLRGEERLPRRHRRGRAIDRSAADDLARRVEGAPRLSDEGGRHAGARREAPGRRRSAAQPARPRTYAVARLRRNRLLGERRTHGDAQPRLALDDGAADDARPRLGRRTRPVHHASRRCLADGHRSPSG